MSRSRLTPEQRRAMVNAVRNGMSKTTAAKTFGVSRQTVWKWYKRAHHRGRESFRDLPPGERARLASNAKRRLRYWLKRRYRSKDVKKLVEKVRNGFDRYFPTERLETIENFTAVFCLWYNECRYHQSLKGPPSGGEEGFKTWLEVIS